jgi:hypothetical protein
MLLQWLARRAPDIDWPAPSTAGDLLARRGLLKKRRPHRPHYHPGVVAPVTQAPNDLWTADFKGHFHTRRGVLLKRWLGGALARFSLRFVVPHIDRTHSRLDPRTRQTRPYQPRFRFAA